LIMPFWEVKHTADRMVEVESKTLPGLFEEALKALCFLYGKAGVKKDVKQKRVNIRLRAKSPEELLVLFLNEIIFLTEREKLTFPSGKVRITREGEDNLLTASVINGKLSYSTEIKSATYHNLKIKKVKNRWRTRIVFDV